jgi:hypothetical protein
MPVGKKEYQERNQADEIRPAALNDRFPVLEEPGFLPGRKIMAISK